MHRIAGKTYTIQALLLELGKFSQNSLIVDYTNGFTNKQLEQVVIDTMKPKQHVIRQEPLEVNPFRQQLIILMILHFPKILLQRPNESAAFSEIYQFGDQQKAALYSAVRTGIMEVGMI